jgi:rfaE bifunctional protein kinase chain/domain
MELLLHSFRNIKVLVVGDVMVDAYLYGKVSRISPEAPVPILDIDHREYRLGGAANVALNIQALGATPLLFSVIGDDEPAKILKEILNKHSIDASGVLASPLRRTTVKFRIIGNHTQLMRVDEEQTDPISSVGRNALLGAIMERLEVGDINAVIFVDYDKGVLTPEIIREIVAYARKNNIVVAVDPKHLNFDSYQDVTLFKPNAKELYEGLHIHKTEFSISEIELMMRKFAHSNNLDHIMTTLSENGIALFDRIHDRFYHLPAYPRITCDVSGAGDSVIAVATLALCTEMNLTHLLTLSNLTGGIVCDYEGVVPVSIEMLKEEYMKKNASV